MRQWRKKQAKQQAKKRRFPRRVVPVRSEQPAAPAALPAVKQEGGLPPQPASPAALPAVKQEGGLPPQPAAVKEEPRESSVGPRWLLPPLVPPLVPPRLPMLAPSGLPPVGGLQLSGLAQELEEEPAPAKVRGAAAGPRQLGHQLRLHHPWAQAPSPAMHMPAMQPHALPRTPQVCVHCNTSATVRWCKRKATGETLCRACW